VVGADTLVVSSAIRPDNPELVAARAAGLRVLHRAAALASVMLGRRGVAVAGTHGKTTTTSMITTALRHCGADPGYVIGGILTETGLGAEDGTGEVFVAEADESDGSFLMLAPEVAVVTCVEADHLDNYSSLAEIEDAFAAFARRIRPGGVLITCADDPGARALAAAAAALPIRVRTYGEAAGADYRITSVAPRGMSVGLEIEGPPRGAPGGARPAWLQVGVPGRHNALNAAAAYAAVVELGLPAAPAGQVTAEFDHGGVGGGGWSPRAMQPGSPCSTATPTIRPSSPPTCGRRATSRPAAGSSRFSSPTCSAAPGSSPASSAPRSAWPTRRSCSASTPPARIPSPV
jgi:UDP-N-acetylmuramate-alanine ligase